MTKGHTLSVAGLVQVAFAILASKRKMVRKIAISLTHIGQGKDDEIAHLKTNVVEGVSFLAREQSYCVLLSGTFSLSVPFANLQSV